MKMETETMAKMDTQTTKIMSYQANKIRQLINNSDHT